MPLPVPGAHLEAFAGSGRYAADPHRRATLGSCLLSYVLIYFVKKGE
ncbi:MAG: hypothetical protein GQ528_03375 [Woeseiaceae bacterium]|nr:hypothetical protein [Woeseiaceae bacterium]